MMSARWQFARLTIDAVKFRGCQRVRREASRRYARGFTLVELLVVVAIIGILTGLAVGSMYAATERARHTRTEMLIRKLHIELIRRWESYETRRLPIVMASGENLDDFSESRLTALRELMRMEMPDRYSDVKYFNTDSNQFEYFPAIRFPGVALNTPNNRPAIVQAYLRRLSVAEDELIANRADVNTRREANEAMVADNQAAEMLYMLLTTPFDGEDVSASISEKYVGDTDGDSMPEFLDGWGNPIVWIRWPAGFLNVTATGDSAPEWGYVTDMHMVEWGPGVDGSLVTDDDAITDPDPFDIRGNDQFLANYSDRPPASEPDTIAPPARLLWGYRLVPLIVSGGPDGEPGLSFGRDVGGADIGTLLLEYSKPYYFWDEPTGSGTYVRRGTPRPYDFLTQELSDDGVWVHFDNITNHLMEAR